MISSQNIGEGGAQISADFTSPQEAEIMVKVGWAIPEHSSKSSEFSIIADSVLILSRTGFAELLSDMYKQTVHAVNEQHVELYVIQNG